jgi:predicted membrane channel-forming protein YqfA (hemolysin III family)
MILYKWLASFGSYVVGFIFYALQLPEKRWPGRFDLIAHSHQIWHIFVFTGAYIYYVAVLFSASPLAIFLPSLPKLARELAVGSV